MSLLSRRNGLFILAIFTQLGLLVSAHPHHGDGGNSEAPIDAILWIHIIVQLAVWGGLFGVGMVLGITRCVASSRLYEYTNSLSRPGRNGTFQSRYAFNLMLMYNFLKMHSSLLPI